MNDIEFYRVEKRNGFEVKIPLDYRLYLAKAYSIGLGIKPKGKTADAIMLHVIETQLKWIEESKHERFSKR